MEIKVIKDEKDLLEVEINNLTIVEILRIYLNKNGAKLAVWKRNHPSEAPILHVEGDNPKKMVKDAVIAIEKEIDAAVSEFKKLK